MAKRDTFNISKLQSAVNKAVERSLIGIANKLIDSMKVTLTDERHVATGDIRDSFDFNITQQPGHGITLRVFNRSPHAIFAEFGRRPGQRPPPPEPIRRWLDAKGLPSDPRTVYLVSRKIARDGIPAIRFMARAFAQNKDNAKESLQGAIQTAIDELRVQ